MRNKKDLNNKDWVERKLMEYFNQLSIDRKAYVVLLTEAVLKAQKKDGGKSESKKN